MKTPCLMSHVSSIEATRSTRRSFLGLAAKASLAVLAFSFGITSWAMAQDNKCPGTHILNPPFRFWSQPVDPPGKDAAIARWKKEAEFFCEHFCKDRKCDDPALPNCIGDGFEASDMFMLKPPEAVKPNEANGQIEECKCKCSKQTATQAFEESIKGLPEKDQKEKRKVFDELWKRGEHLFKEWQKEKKERR